MSIKAMQYVFESDTTKGSKRLMLLSIADRCDDEGVCFPSVNNLAKKCNVTRRQALNLIYDLERMGELGVIDGDGLETKNGCTNRYVMTKYRKSIGLNNDDFPIRTPPKKECRTFPKTDTDETDYTSETSYTPETSNTPTSETDFTPTSETSFHQSQVVFQDNSKRDTPNGDSPPEKPKTEYQIMWDEISDVLGKSGYDPTLKANKGLIGKIQHNMKDNKFTPADVKPFMRMVYQKCLEKEKRKPEIRDYLYNHLYAEYKRQEQQPVEEYKPRSVELPDWWQPERRGLVDVSTA